MKRYATHFLFLPEYGYLKQYVIETEEGRVVHMFPLTEEIENVEWLPGAIILLNQEELLYSERIHVKFRKKLLSILPPSVDRVLRLFPLYFSQFDITTMLPVAGTRHKLLP